MIQVGKTLITGADQIIGAVVAECLISLREPFRVLARNPEQLPEYLTSKADTFQTDYQNPDSIAKAMAGQERLFLCSAPDPNLQETEERLIKLAQRSGIQYIVKISFPSLGGGSKVKMAQLHAASEAFIQESGLGYAILRPHYFMQNLEVNAPSIVAEGKIEAPIGEQEVPMVDARDVGEAAAMLLTQKEPENQLLELTGPKSISFSEIAESLSRQLDREIAYASIPFETELAYLIEQGLPKWEAEDQIAWMQSWMDANLQPTDSMKSILGRSPRSVGEYISDHLKLFQAEET